MLTRAARTRENPEQLSKQYLQRQVNTLGYRARKRLGNLSAGPGQEMR
jgi:hypothetical protein